MRNTTQDERRQSERPVAADEVIRAWLATHSASTREAYMADLHDFATFCEAQDVADPLAADADLLDAYQADMRARSLSVATIARRFSALSGLYRYAASESMIDESPVALVERPRPERRPPTLGLTRGELTDLLDAAAASGPRDHALAALLVLNGLRVSEACEADASDLSTMAGHPVLAITRKGGVAAVSPLAGRTREALDAYLSGRRTGPLFLDNTGQDRLDRHDAGRIVRRLGKAAGIEQRVTPDTLRHSFASVALEAGASLQELQEASGHTDPRTIGDGRELDSHPTFAVASALDRGSSRPNQPRANGVPRGEAA